MRYKTAGGNLVFSRAFPIVEILAFLLILGLGSHKYRLIDCGEIDCSKMTEIGTGRDPIRDEAITHNEVTETSDAGIIGGGDMETDDAKCGPHRVRYFRRKHRPTIGTFTCFSSVNFLFAKSSMESDYMFENEVHHYRRPWRCSENRDRRFGLVGVSAFLDLRCFLSDTAPFTTVSLMVVLAAVDGAMSL